LRAANSPGLWPEITRENKPWTRWWWPGSAVERESLAAQLREFADAGLGGVEITPIYGARGSERRDVEFLSPRWTELLAFTTAESRRLGLGVDMATGTGWPFGGPRVPPADGSVSLQFADGRLSGKPTQMKVKRAAPGAEGLVLDPYSPEALARYLEPFTGALSKLPRGAVRSQFHDSFEYYNATWTPNFFEEFQKRRGYDLRPHLRELNNEGDKDTIARVKCDYRETLSDLHLEYMNKWVSWTHTHNMLGRNQAHGGPGNILDVYD